jgi:hypothetical protein
VHSIEPYFHWRDYYIAEEDEKSPFFGRTYSEFEFTNTIYNYYIHPQWDEIGSPTLYIKIIFVDYDKGYAIIELIGEWNDAIGNDIMFLKRDIADRLMEKGIYKFMLIGENVLNFHGSDDCYYEEWYDDVKDAGGYIVLLNFRDHVVKEMERTRLHYYINMGERFNEIDWRTVKPFHFHKLVEGLMMKSLGNTGT